MRRKFCAFRLGELREKTSCCIHRPYRHLMANETFDYCQAFFEHEKTDQVLWQLFELLSYLIYIACYQKYTVHNLGKITPSVTPAACHLPQRGRRIMAPSLRGLSAQPTGGVLKLWIVILY